MEDSMDDSLDNAEEDMAFHGNSKDDETSSSVETLFKVEESGDDSGGEDRGDFQGFRGRHEGSSGEDGIYEDAGGGSNAASDPEGYLERVSDYEEYDGSPPPDRGLRASASVISGFTSLGEEGGSLLDAFDPNADLLFVDRSAKNASPAGKIFRELRSSTEGGGCGRNIPARDDGDKESIDEKFLGFSMDSNPIRGASFHKLATVNSLCDDGSEENIVAGDSDQIETRMGACQENVSCSSGEEANIVCGMGIGDKDQSPAEGRVERAVGKKGARTARRQVDAFSASDFKCGGGISTFEGFDVGDVVGPERLTRSRASGRYVPVKNANGESIVILASSFPVSQRVDDGVPTNSPMKEVSGKVTGKRSASRGGRLGWSNSVESTIHGDTKRGRASKGTDEACHQQSVGPASATLRKKKSSERSMGKEGKSAKRTSGVKSASRRTHLKLSGKSASQFVKSAVGEDGREQENAHLESASAVKRRTPRPRSKLKAHAVDGQLQASDDLTPCVVPGRVSQRLSFDVEPMPGRGNPSRRQLVQRGPRLASNHESQMDVGHRQVAAKDMVSSLEAAGECPNQLLSDEADVGKETGFSEENGMKLQGDGSFGSIVLDESKATPTSPLQVGALGEYGATAHVASHSVQLSLSQDMFGSAETEALPPKLLNMIDLGNGGTDSVRRGFLDANLGSGSTAGTSRMSSTKIESLEIKPLRNGEVCQQLSLLEGISRSGTTDPICVSTAGLSEETLGAGIANAMDVVEEKSVGPDGIGSDFPAGTVFDNAEMLSFAGRETSALRPRRCKSELSNGTLGANVAVCRQPIAKSRGKQKKQAVGSADVTETAVGKLKAKLKGKRKRGGAGLVSATNSQICSENKSMTQEFEDTIDVRHHSEGEGEVLMHKDGSGKKRKKRKKEAGKMKTINSKKQTRKLSSQINTSECKLKTAEDIQIVSGDSENHVDIERALSSGTFAVCTDDVKQLEKLENHGQSLEDLPTGFLELRKGSKEGNKLNLGTEKQISDSWDHTSLDQKGERLARMKTLGEGTNNLSSSSTQKDIVGDGVLEDVPIASAGREQNTKSSSTSVSGQELSEDGPPRVGWVLCDACSKWRCIPSELADQIEATDATWTCKENPNKNYADCSIPQEKSNAEINAELQISEFSGAEEDVDRDIECGSQQEIRQAVWTLIPRNIYLHRQRKHTTIDEMMVCNCQPPTDGSPGCDENCINRILQVECPEGHCPCGDTCSNQQFRHRSYSKVESFRCGKKGFGLRAMANIAKGNFIIEYVGEVLDIDAFEIRQKEYARNGQKHFYFMTLDGNEVIDACVKGNLGRFINHSCEPNCQTEKWVVNGELCIGLFATRGLVEGEEITFDYNYVRVGGAAAKKCECGSPGCRGFIGGDPLTPRAVVESDSDEEEDPEPIMLDGSLEAETRVSAPGRVADVNKSQSTRKTRVASEPKVKGAPKGAGVKRRLSRDTEGDRDGSKPRHSAAVKRVKTSKSQVPKNGLVHVKGLTIDTSHRQQRSDVEEKLNEMLDENGGLRKKKDSAKHFLRLLVLVPVSVDSQSGLSSQRSRGLKDLSLLLDALQKTRSPVVLRDIMCKNGLMMLHNLIKHFRKDYEKLPIVRKLMKVLDWLASQKVLTPDQMYASRPVNGIESFTESLFELTRHSDKEVQNMARNFRRVYLPPSSKLSDHSMKENGWPSPPKNLQPLEQLNARGRVAAPGFHQQLPPVHESNSSLAALDQVSKPANPLQKFAGQDWSPSGTRSAAPGCCAPGIGAASSCMAPPERAPETGKTLNPSEGASKEQDVVLANDDGAVPRKRKRKSRWDEPAVPAQAVEAVSTPTGQIPSNSIGGGQIVLATPPSTVPGSSVQLPAEWSKQATQGYQRYWHQQQAPKHLPFRDHVASSPVPGGAGPPLPPGFTANPAPPPTQFGPSANPQSNLYCGPIAGQQVGPRKSSQGQVPVPPMHSLSSFPSAASGPHLSNLPGAQQGSWHVRGGAPVFTGPPGFQVDVPDREHFSSPWSRRHTEQREMWSHPKEQLNCDKAADEVEPEPPVPGLSPQDQQRTGDHCASTHRDCPRDPIGDHLKVGEIKEPGQVGEIARVCIKSEVGSPENIDRGHWVGKSRPPDDEQRGPPLPGQSDRDRIGSGRTDTRKDRVHGPSRWEYSESTLQERGRRYDSWRSKDTTTGRGNLSPYQQSEGHGRSHHRRLSKEMDYIFTGDRCFKEGNVVAQSIGTPEPPLTVNPGKGVRADCRMSEPDDSSQQHVVQSRSGWDENQGTLNSQGHHKFSTDIEAKEGRSQVAKGSEGEAIGICDGATLKPIVHTGGCSVGKVSDSHGIYVFACEVEEKSSTRSRGNVCVTPSRVSPEHGKAQLDQQSLQLLRKGDANDALSGNPVEERSILSNQVDSSCQEPKGNASAPVVSGSGALTAYLLPSGETSCMDVQQCNPAGDSEVHICSGSTPEELAQDLAEGAGLQKRSAQNVRAPNLTDASGSDRHHDCHVERDPEPYKNRASAVEGKDLWSEARTEPGHAGWNEDGRRHDSVIQRQEFQQAEWKVGNNVDGKYRSTPKPCGDDTQPDSVGRSQWDGGSRNDAQLSQISSKLLADAERQLAGSHSGHASERSNPAEQQPTQNHNSSGRASGGEVPGRKHSFRPGVDGWESPESPGFQEHVQALVRHFLTAYKKLNPRDLDKLNGRLGPEVIKKERKSYMTSTQTGCAKPIIRKRLDDKVRNFVDQQARLYLAMKEKDRRG